MHMDNTPATTPPRGREFRVLKKAEYDAHSSRPSRKVANHNTTSSRIRRVVIIVLLVVVFVLRS